MCEVFEANARERLGIDMVVAIAEEGEDGDVKRILADVSENLLAGARSPCTVIGACRKDNREKKHTEK